MKNEISKEVIIDIRDDRFKDVEKQIEKMQVRAKEFCQTRSDHQLEKFIACEEYTPISKFRHTSHNSYVAMQEIRRMIIDRERKLREIARKQESFDNNEQGSEDYDLDIYELERQLEDVDIRISGLSKEVDYMEKICDHLEKDEIVETGSGFTSEKYQDREPDYWRKRFANQMHRTQMGTQLGVGEGNYMSYLQSLQTPILPDSDQQIEPIPLEPNAIATIALKDRPGVNNVMLKQLSDEEIKQLEEQQRAQIETGQ